MQALASCVKFEIDDFSMYLTGILDVDADSGSGGAPSTPEMSSRAR
jgi:hypothetical protein